MLVDIAIATYRRPELLQQALGSLAAQKLRDDTSIRIIVIDNDDQASAREVVDSFRDGCSIPVIYAVEPRQNLSLARNRALDLAQTEYLAIIDDDELADQHWLQNLLDCGQAFGADVVFGPALAVHPAGVPAWMAAGRFFDWPRYPTGTRLRIGDTANVLIRRAVLHEHGARFAPEFGLTGAEDTELFHRLGRGGAKLVWCDEAIVHAPVAPGRANLRYLLARSFRYGRNWARVTTPAMPLASRAAWLLVRVAVLMAGGSLAPLMLPLSRPAGVWLLCKAMRSLGYLTVLRSRPERTARW